MKSILIIGASNSGKSTTMSAVCSKLQPTEVLRLIPNINNYQNSRKDVAKIEDIYNNTFIVKVKGKYILICAGAPTEQNITITTLIEICVQINVEISFCLVSMRSSERKAGFDTPVELRSKSEIILTEKIYRILDADYNETYIWTNRVNKIVNMVLENI